VHWVAGGRFVGPYVLATQVTDVGRNLYAPIDAKPYPIHFFVRGAEGHKVLWLIPTRLRFLGVDPPAHLYLFGSDKFGRDVLSRLLYGSRVSLTIGLLGIAISFAIGMLVGGLSGMLGGGFDLVTMRVTELILAIPALYLILALRAAFPMNMPSDRMYLIIVFILAFIGWASLGRVVRGMVLSIREFEYVNAARALGAGPMRILWRHILPNIMPPIIVLFTTRVGTVILAESSLSFLGLGVPPPTPTWGGMLSGSGRTFMFQGPWLALAPGLCLTVVVYATNVFGDALRDLLDPRMRGSR
jgi:peptide/nickel transport system permease protein